MVDRKTILADFQKAKEYKKEWNKQAKEDYEFLVGQQWDQKDLDELRGAGKPALTLNKIQAMIFLISGIQRQNRTDYKAYPVGEEDTIKADAISFLLKDMMRSCDGDYKESEMFEHGICCGEGWLEPYIDYAKDIVDGDLMFRAVNGMYVFVDPASKEYDHSDARFIIKYTKNLTKEQLLALFPDKEQEINDIAIKTIDEADNGLERTVITADVDDDYDTFGERDGYETVDAEELDYNMIEYHYYEQKPLFLVCPISDKSNYTSFETKALAEQFAQSLDEAVEIKKRFVSVPRISVLVNGVEIDDYVNEFYPRYNKITLFPFYAHKISAPIKKRELLVQGIINSLKDPQREINKRRSNELHHLNTSSNSGWLNKKKGGFIDEDDVAKFGSSPGVVLNYLNERPERITPVPLSAGHEAIVQQSNKDLKEISGINTDLLAMNDKASTSGRAIHLRQQQGLMMIQRILDNFARSRREVGRFLISQIGEVYSVQKAIRAIGESWIKNIFSKPIMQPAMDPMTGQPAIDPQTGQQAMLPVMEGGQMKMEIDQEEVQAFLKMILDQSDIARYDVMVGDVATSETIKLANYTMLLEFRQQGIPIPPEVIIEESMLSTTTKGKIMKAVASAQQAAQGQQQPAQ